jgi:hypothetical protein
MIMKLLSEEKETWFPQNVSAEERAQLNAIADGRCSANTVSNIPREPHWRRGRGLKWHS